MSLSRMISITVHLFRLNAYGIYDLYYFKVYCVINVCILQKLVFFILVVLFFLICQILFYETLSSFLILGLLSMLLVSSLESFHFV